MRLNINIKLYPTQILISTVLCHLISLKEPEFVCTYILYTVHCKSFDESKILTINSTDLRKYTFTQLINIE